MSFTPEQLAQILEVVRQVTMAQQVANTPVDPLGLRCEHRGWTIDAKCFRANAFGGDARGMGSLVFRFEANRAQVQEHLLAGEGSGSMSPDVVSKFSAELYDVLCQVVSGEAMTILRSVEDCRGFVAWQKLRHKLNPKKGDSIACRSMFSCLSKGAR